MNRNYVNDTGRNLEEIFDGFIAKAIQPFIIDSFPELMSEEIDDVSI